MYSKCVISCTVTFLLLLAALASAKTSQSHGPKTGDSILQAPAHRKAETRSSNAGFDVRFFAPLDGSTLPPVVTSADRKYSSSGDDDQTKGEKLRASRWTNEIVRRSFADGSDQDGKSDKKQPETSGNKLAGSATDREHGIAENKKSLEVRRSSKGSSSVSEVMPTQRDRDEDNTTQNHATAGVTSNLGTADDEVETSYYDNDADDGAEYDEAADYDFDEEYDDEKEEEDDDSKVVEDQEDEKREEKRANDKTSVGREYIEYEISADSSRPVDYDETNTEVVNELQVVNQRRRRKGRPRTVKKTRKRRRKRPPVEPVGRVKIPKRKRRPTSNTGARRRKPKARRRRKGQNKNKARKRRKNRRNKQTASLSFDFGGNNKKVDRAEVGQSRKPRLQQSASEIIQRLQQQYQQQQQQQNEYDGQYYASRYQTGHDRRRIFAAPPTNFRGQSSHEAATNRGVQASVIGRIPPVHGAEQTSPRPQATDLQGRYVDPRHYHRPPQHQHRTYYNHQPHSQPQQHQHQHHQRPLYTRQFYHYQQQSAPTYSRHQQQIHFIVPTNDFDLRRIPEVMSALGLQHYVSGPIAVGEAQLQFLGDQSLSSNSGGAYREGHPARRPGDEDVVDERQLSSLSSVGPASSSEAVKHVRRERSTNDRRRILTTSDSDDEEAHHATRDRSDDNSEEYVDNSDIEITTRSPTHQTTALI